MKPGVKTSEFWVLAVVWLVSFAVSSGLVQTEKSDQLIDALVTVISGLISLATPIAYLISRTYLKVKGPEDASKK